MDPTSLSQAIDGLSSGRREAVDAILPVIYDDLRALAARRLRFDPLSARIQPTELVHEAVARLIDRTGAVVADETHLLALAARAMRQVLVDQARRRDAAKRGGDAVQVTLALQGCHEPAAPEPTITIDLEALNTALERLATVDERRARIVELRYFAGLTIEQIGRALGHARSTVTDDLALARAWLRAELDEGPVP